METVCGIASTSAASVACAVTVDDEHAASSCRHARIARRSRRCRIGRPHRAVTRRVCPEAGGANAGWHGRASRRRSHQAGRPRQPAPHPRALTHNSIRVEMPPPARASSRTSRCRRLQARSELVSVGERPCARRLRTRLLAKSRVSANPNDVLDGPSRSCLPRRVRDEGAAPRSAHS